MDLSNLSISELKDLQARIPAAIEKKKSEEKQNLMKETEAFLAAKGFTLDDLMGKAKAGRKGGPRGPVAVKYRHPDNSALTWTGRGRKPGWIVEWLSNGKTMDAIAI
jgi:DNA-binding protein H-NS